MGRRGLAHARVVADGEDADGVIGAVGVEIGGEVGRGPADDVVVVGVGLLDHPCGEEGALEAVDEDDVGDSLGMIAMERRYVLLAAVVEEEDGFVEVVFAVVLLARVI